MDEAQGRAGMTQLAPGSAAPAFTLPDLEGRDVAFDPIAPGHKVLVFYNSSCHTCQICMPLFDRLFTRFGDDPIGVYAIAQESPERARAFARDRGVTMPHLVDDRPYPVSRAYKLMNVPTLYVIDAAGQVVVVSPAFVREHVEQAADLMASDRTGLPPTLFDDSEEIPLIKPG